MDIAFVKGHGTQNDFVLVPDAGGQLDLTDEQVRFLCDRRSGLGADGVIRVVRTDATEDPAAVAARGEATWFMDYRNSDGSVSEMCGNGVRVLGLYLATHADVDVRSPLPIATRAGIKTLSFSTAGISVDMGVAKLVGGSRIGLAERSWIAKQIDVGNPHAVVFLDDGQELGELSSVGEMLPAPTHDPVSFPEGVNVEFVKRGNPTQVSMRVHERGSGETMSCGTGACAVAFATMLEDKSPAGTAYHVDLPGGRLVIVRDDQDRITLTGPAELVAEGVVEIPDPTPSSNVDESVDSTS